MIQPADLMQTCADFTPLYITPIKRNFLGLAGGAGPSPSTSSTPPPPPPPPTCPVNESGDPQTDYLAGMRQVVFLDLDNWSGFFSRLPGPMPDKTFVWAFYGGDMEWRAPDKLPAFMYTKERGLFHLHGKCGRTKDAADFALVLKVGTEHRRVSVVGTGPHGGCNLLVGTEHFCGFKRGFVCVSHGLPKAQQRLSLSTRWCPCFSHGAWPL